MNSLSHNLGVALMSVVFHLKSRVFRVIFSVLCVFMLSAMAQVSAGSCPVNLPVPSHAFDFDNSSGSRVIDSLAGVEGQISGGVLGIGRSGNGAFFANNLLNARVQLNPFDMDVRNGIALSFWIKPLNFNSVEARYISKAVGTAEADHDLMVSAYNGSRLRFRLRVNNVTKTLVTAGNVLVANSWNHVAVTFDLNDMKIYHNGILVGQSNYPGSISFRSLATMAFGNQPVSAGDRPYWGTIDEIQIFNESLSQQEVAALNTSGGDCEPLEENPISAPKNLSHSFDFNNQVVRLQWSPPDTIGNGIANYIMLRDGSVYASNIVSTQFEDHNVQAGVGYSYAVQAQGVDGSISPTSETLSLVIPTQPDPPVLDPSKLFQSGQLIYNGAVSAFDHGDIDGDGDFDVLAAEGGKHSCGNSCRLLAWFEAPNWRRHDLGTLLGPFTGDGLLADLDKDGDLDVVIATDNHNSESTTDAVYWFENRINANLGWLKHTVELNVPNAFHLGDMASADVDGDGKMDVVIRHLGTYRFVVYFQNSADSWTPRRLNTRPREGLKLADLDRNNRVDIIGNGFILFAPQNPRTEAWTEKTFDANFYNRPNTGLNNSVKANIADLNRDGRLDIVMSSAEGSAVYLAWYANPTDAKNGTWTKTIVESPQANNHQVQIADVDLDGALDIVGGFSFGSYGVYWWQNLNSTATSWKRQVIHSANGCYSCTAGDFDGDGDIDVAGPTKYAGAIYFYKNLLKETGAAK